MSKSVRLISSQALSYTQTATPPKHSKGAVMRRRFQAGYFSIESGGYYSYWYADTDDGGTKRVKRLIGRCSAMSERAARREHTLRMEEVNRARGSRAPILRGQSFAEAVKNWRQAIAPNLSPSTTRAMESQLPVAHYSSVRQRSVAGTWRTRSATIRYRSEEDSLTWNYHPRPNHNSIHRKLCRAVRRPVNKVD